MLFKLYICYLLQIFTKVYKSKLFIMEANFDFDWSPHYKLKIPFEMLLGSLQKNNKNAIEWLEIILT